MQYSSMSRKDAGKPKKEKVAKVTKGKAVVKERSTLVQKIEKFSGMEIGELGGYILDTIIKPAVLNVIAAILGQPGNYRGGSYTSSNVSYGYRPNYSAMSRPQDSQQRQARQAYRFEPIIMETKDDAKVVLDNLNDMVYDSDYATVGDMYDMAGVTPSPVDYYWGWRDLSMARMQRVPEGYLLVMPRPVYLSEARG